MPEPFPFTLLLLIVRKSIITKSVNAPQNAILNPKTQRMGRLRFVLHNTSPSPSHVSNLVEAPVSSRNGIMGSALGTYLGMYGVVLVLLMVYVVEQEGEKDKRVVFFAVCFLMASTVCTKQSVLYVCMYAPPPVSVRVSSPLPGFMGVHPRGSFLLFHILLPNTYCCSSSSVLPPSYPYEQNSIASFLALCFFFSPSINYLFG